MWASGMGTKVQSKMHLPGYHSLRDLNDDASGGVWPLYHESKTLKNGQYHNLFSTRPASDESFGYDMEKLRQTILKHESIFRHQLHELHRIYKKQTNLMNEIKSREPHKQSAPARISQSILPSSSTPSDDKKRWHASSLPLAASYCGRLSKSGTDSNQSHLDVKGKIMQSSRDYFLNGESLKDCELLESKCQKPQKLFIDLELPADEYIGSEEKDLGVSGVSRVESHSCSQNDMVTCRRDVSLSFGRSVKSDCRGDASYSNSYLRRTPCLADLNEPNQFEKVSTSASLDIPIPLPSMLVCSKEEKQRWNLSGNLHSAFDYMGKELPNSFRGRDDGIINLHLQNDRKKESLSFTTEAGQALHDKKSLCGSSCPENRCTSFGSVGLHSVPQSDFTNSEPFFASSQRRLPSALSQLVVEGHHCSNTSAHSNVNPKILMRSHEFSGDLLCDSKPIPTVKAELPFQNGLYLDSQLAASNESQVCRRSPISFDCTNGINDSVSAREPFAKKCHMNYIRGLECSKDAKPISDVKANVVPFNKYRNKVLSQQESVLNDMQRRHESPQGGLSWLREMLLHNGKASKEKEDCDLSNMDSLQNRLGQFANGTGLRNSLSRGLTQDLSSATHDNACAVGRNKVGDCSNISKVHGLPFFYKPHVSKDLSTPSSTAKPNHLLSPIDRGNSVKVELFGTDISHDFLCPKSRDHRKVEGQVLDKGLVNPNADFRYHIDLNLCVTEDVEEAQLKPSSPKIDVNISAEIDLEVAVVGAKIGVTHEDESLESIPSGPFTPQKDDARNPHEGRVRDAADALVAMSTSRVHNLEENDTCNIPEASRCNPLIWFAEIISSYKSDYVENELESVSVLTGGYCRQEHNPDGMDYFELMTLSLKETKVDECSFEPQPQELEDNSEKVLTKRPRRGQARRGRQRKDFQRDILPGLVSLSRYEVVEDLQIIEGMIGATGGTWQSSLSRRNAAKSGRGRGRKNSGGSFTSPTETSPSPTKMQEPKCNAPGLEDKSLMSWGKRTRRLPRTRYPNAISNPRIPVT